MIHSVGPYELKIPFPTTYSTVSETKTGTLIKDIVDASATAVILHVKTDAWTAEDFGLRKPGSTDSNIDWSEGIHEWAIVGVNNDKEFQAYFHDHTPLEVILDHVHLYLVGYTCDESVLFTNAVDKTPAIHDSWQTVDLSALCPNAIGIIGEVISEGGWFWGVRKHGSTDNRVPVSVHTWFVIGCDDDQKIDFYSGFFVYYFSKLLVKGYITKQAIFLLNGVDISPAGVGAYEDKDIDSIIAGAGMAFVEVVPDHGNYALRPDGSSEDIYGGASNHGWGMVPLTSGILNVKKSKANATFHLVGAPLFGTPTVVTDPATNVEEETATLNGEITAIGVGNADQRGFDWGLNTSYGNSWTESDSYGVAAFSHAISGLSPGTIIHFRAKAHNSAGWGYGGDLTFTTKPEACTNMVATAISDTQIDVSWTKGDGAVNTVVRRKVGAYPANIADGDEAYNGPSASFSDQGLIPSTAYYYRAWSYTDPHYADAYCQDNATTQALPPAILPPTVTTESANNLNQTLATINGALTNDGGEACDCWFEYAKVGDTIYTTAVQSGKTTGDLFLADLTGLTHNTRYHFRAVARNSTGTSYGVNMYFVTESPALLEYSLLQPELAELLR